MTDFDLVVRHGTVIDGTGEAAILADVAVNDGKIVQIGRVDGRGEREIDAEGHIVAPGFIDAHTHMDAQVQWAGLGESPAWHGVTTAVMGNCGFTLAPCRATEANLAFLSMERAEDISRRAMELGINWSWETFAEFLDALEQVPKGINYAGYVGHSALRTYVMGERAFHEPASSSEIAQMCAEVKRSVAAGAVGFSTSRSHNHLTFDDRPVASRCAEWEEVRAIVRALGEMGHGVFQLAPERERDTAADFKQRISDLAVETMRPVTFMIAGDPWLLDLLDEVAARGGAATGQVNVRPTLSILSFLTSLPFDKLPLWGALHVLPPEQKLERLQDPVSRKHLVQEAMNGQYEKTVGAEARPPDFSRLCPLNAIEGPFVSVETLARERGVTPVDVMIDQAVSTKLHQLFLQPLRTQNEDEIIEWVRNDRTVVAASDAGAHVSQIMDSAIPTYLLAHWVRNKRAFSWEEAVRKLTFEPARLMGFTDRGLLKSGWAADIVVFDPGEVAPMLPTVTFDLPDGSPRLVQKAAGVTATVVNGRLLTEEGRHTGEYPGQVLRTFA
jgi:N-acyl-D-amino-acid deacylase